MLSQSESFLHCFKCGTRNRSRPHQAQGHMKCDADLRCCRIAGTVIVRLTTNTASRRPNGFATRIGRTLRLPGARRGPLPAPPVFPQTTRGPVSRISSRRRMALPLTRREFYPDYPGAALWAPVAVSQRPSHRKRSILTAGRFPGFAGLHRGLLLDLGALTERIATPARRMPL